MTAPVNFYREVDLVKEGVIPKQEGTAISSHAKEASIASSNESNNASRKIIKLVGDNELVDGISVRSPTYLASYLRRLRQRLAGAVDKVSTSLEKTSSHYYKHENSITSTIANLHSEPREKLLPGFTYIAVAAMTGSILTKNKNAFYRLTAPLALGSLCFFYVLPTTFQNTTALLHELEARKFPHAVARQDTIIKKTQQLSCATVHYADKGVKSIAWSVARFQHYIKEWTGLNVE